jgi:CRISPR/Cas system-associated exonuclease Cas4 (RecB family)
VCYLPSVLQLLCYFLVLFKELPHICCSQMSNGATLAKWSLYLLAQWEPPCQLDSHLEVVLSTKKNKNLSILSGKTEHTVKSRILKEQNTRQIGRARVNLEKGMFADIQSMEGSETSSLPIRQRICNMNSLQENMQSGCNSAEHTESPCQRATWQHIEVWCSNLQGT